MITVKTIPNTLWNAAKSVNSKVSARTKAKDHLERQFPDGREDDERQQGGQSEPEQRRART